MSPAMPFDEATSRRVEAAYSTPDVAGQRRTVLAALGLKPGEDVLDIGSGPGFLACEMSSEVAPGGSVTGVDPSGSMLSIARARSRPAGSAPAEFRPGEATALPCAAGSFDVVTSTQVYEYVDDVPAALAEAWRVLRPGGRLLVLDTDWDSIVWRSGDDDRMRRVLRAWDGHLADPHLPRRLTGLLGDPAGGHPVAERRLRSGHAQRRAYRIRLRVRAQAGRDHGGRDHGLGHRPHQPRARIFLQPQSLSLRGCPELDPGAALA
jgi:SAM-dependent methyltransferase